MSCIKFLTTVRLFSK